jgi:hypothetical protein
MFSLLYSFDVPLLLNVSAALVAALLVFRPQQIRILRHIRRHQLHRILFRVVHLK